MSVIPVILLGQFEEVGKAFADAVKPNFEVIHFTTTPAAALSEIPLLLKGEIPAAATTTSASAKPKVGTGNLIHGAPKAIVIGAPTYDEAFVESARKELAVLGKSVPILKPDSGVGAAKHDGPSAEKAALAAERAVSVLKKLDDEGKLDGDDDGVYVY
ncbi:hypothetical protein M426DRAFT_224002 [Hypoxylon sp. CI-4A]|nr:hypothetical protein M426DRAFT_224002 [Hypoxylon sp. CI-4A]